MDPKHPLLASAGDELVPFPASFPQLSRLDRIPYCPICKELYRGPVSISCGHSFCSACIRSFLDVQKKCPSCHEPAKEGSIRRNRALEEITDAWEEARPGLLEMAQGQGRGGRSRPRRSRAETSESGSAGPRKRRRSETGSTHGESSDEVVELTESDESACPMCGVVMKISAIPTHIDKGCPPPRVNQKADWKKVFSGAGSAKDKLSDRKRIVKPNYSLISTAELRGLLTEHGLQTNGERSALEARFQDWTVLYNANLDTSHPCSLQALRTQVTSREAARAADKKTGREEQVEELKSKEGLVRHAREQRGEFERLRQEILARKGKRGQGEAKAGAVDSPIEVE